MEHDWTAAAADNEDRLGVTATHCIIYVGRIKVKVEVETSDIGPLDRSIINYKLQLELNAVKVFLVFWRQLYSNILNFELLISAANSNWLDTGN